MYLNRRAKYESRLIDGSATRLAALGLDTPYSECGGIECGIDGLGRGMACRGVGTSPTAAAGEQSGEQEEMTDTCAQIVESEQVDIGRSAILYDAYKRW